MRSNVDRNISIPIVSPTRYSNFYNLFYFWDNALHVSDGPSVCWLARRQKYLFDIHLLLYVQSWTPDDGRKDRPKHVERYPKNKINWRSLLHLVGFGVEIYCDARSYERQS
jgi:hypothetical protein